MWKNSWLYRNLANILTCSRMLAPLVLALPTLSAEEKLVWCVPLAVTDFFDGKLARWLKLESAMGRVLDPIADKIMILSVLVFVYSEFLVDRQIANWMIVGEVAIAFLVVLGIYLVLKQEKKIRLSSTQRRPLSVVKLRNNWIHGYQEVRSELTMVMRVNVFGKGKTFAYFMGGVCVALNTWYPHEYLVLGYHVAFAVGLILMFVSLILYCQDFYHWQKKFEN